MKKNKWYFYLIITTLFFQNPTAANNNFQRKDSLLAKTYRYLQYQSKPTKSTKAKATIYAKAWLNKAKLEQNWMQASQA